MENQNQTPMARETVSYQVSKSPSNTGGSVTRDSAEKNHFHKNISFYFFPVLVFLALISAYFLSFSSEENKENLIMIPHSTGLSLQPDIQMKEEVKKTLFSFSETETVLLEKDGKKEIQILLTSDYEPVTSGEISVQFNPLFADVSNISATEKSVLFSKINEERSGVFSATLAFPDGILGENIPVLSFDILHAGSRTGETQMTFVADALSALLSDTENTNTAQKNDLKPLVVSVLQ